MRKTNKLIVLMLAMLMLFAFAACSRDSEQERSGSVQYDMVAIDNNKKEFDAQDMVYWGSSNCGKAEVDGDYIKIYSFKNQAGGIKSPYRTVIDFTSEVYFNFYGFSSINENVTLAIKVFFVGYNEKESCYVMKHDYIGLKGDFSINIDNALQRYDMDSVNMQLYDKLSSQFLLAGKTVETRIEIWAYNNTNSGISNENAWIRFKKFDITYGDSKPVRNFRINSIGNSGININNNASSAQVIKTKGDQALTVVPVEGTGTSNSTNYKPYDGDMIFASDNSKKVAVNENGEVSFVGVTNTGVKILAYPRADISKGGNIAITGGNATLERRSGFYVSVKGIWTAAEVDTKVTEMLDGSTSATASEDFNDLFEGTLLAMQRLYVSSQVEGLRLITNNNTVAVINSLEEAEGDKSFELGLNVNNNSNQTVATTSNVRIIKQIGDTVIEETAATSLTASEQYKHSIAYLKNSEKYMEDARYLVIWNGTTLTSFNTHNVDAQGVQSISAQTLADNFGQDRSWDGLMTEINQDGDFEIKLTLKDLTAFYAQPFLELNPDTTSSKGIVVDFNKNPKMIIEFGDCENLQLNIRFFRIGGIYATGYWDNAGYNFNDIKAGNNLVFLDIAHYANQSGYKSLIQSAAVKKKYVELNFDMQLSGDARTTIDAVGYLTVKNIILYYE